MKKTGKNTFFIQKWWISDSQIAKLKKRVYGILQKKYPFINWHLTSINDRPYAQEIVVSVQKYVNKGNICGIIEVGCGLGDIIGNIRRGKGCKKIGFDTDAAVVKAAAILHPSVIFKQGSFKDVPIYVRGGGNCLIIVDFIHTMSEEELKAEMEKILTTGGIDLIVFDTFVRHENTVYKYSHIGERFLGNQYQCVKKSKGFAAAQGGKKIY